MRQLRCTIRIGSGLRVEHTAHAGVGARARADAHARGYTMPAYDGDDLPTPPSPYGEYVPPPAGYPYPPPAGYLAQTNSRLPEENTPHYGAIGRVPWTLQQTLAGTAITLVPWMAVLLMSAASSSGTHGLTKPLPRSADLIGGIIFFLFSAVVECAFVLAPLYFAVWRRAPGASVQQGWRALG